jgi:hypothetical protein
MNGLHHRGQGLRMTSGSPRFQIRLTGTSSRHKLRTIDVSMDDPALGLMKLAEFKPWRTWFRDHGERHSNMMSNMILK